MAGSARTFDLKPAVRERVPLLVGIVGPSGSGKTWSALRLATGIQRATGGDIAVIDTEARRALHYAEQFKFRHLDFQAPFGSLDYLDAITTCVKQGAKTVVVDTASLEHEGVGGLLDSHEQELTRMAGDNYQKREAMKMLAWAKPKAARRRFLTGITQLNANLIFCFRAKTGAKPVKVNGKTEVQQQGFEPISGDELVYEMTVNILLLPKSDGFPCWQSDYRGEQMAMKLPGQFRDLFAKPAQLSEDIGQRMAEWAAGKPPAVAPNVEDLIGGYAGCRTSEQFNKCEEGRKEIWPSLKKADQTRLKGASEDAVKRLLSAERTLADAKVEATSEPAADLFKNDTGTVPTH